MQTKNRYEEMALKELRGIPKRSQHQVIKILRSLRASINIAGTAKDKTAEGSGLCGIWKDSRDEEEIIADTKTHRTGFGGREPITISTPGRRL